MGAPQKGGMFHGHPSLCPTGIWGQRVPWGSLSGVSIVPNPTFPTSPQESGDDEYRGEHSDSDDEVDSDFDIDEGDEPGSEQDEAEPRRRRRVLTKAYRVPRHPPGGFSCGKTAPKPSVRGFVFVILCFVLQEPLKSLRAKKAEGPRGGSQKSREVKSVPLELQEDGGDSECGVGMGWEQGLGDPSWKWDPMGELLVLQGLGMGSQGSQGDPVVPGLMQCPSRQEAHASVHHGAHPADVPAAPGAPGAIQEEKGRHQLRAAPDPGGAAGGGQDH